MQYLFYTFFCRFFKQALAAAPTQEERVLVLTQIWAVEAKILLVLQTLRERMARENARMQHALDKLDKVHGKK